MKAIRATILMATRTALTLALFDVPITNRPVTTSEIMKANRLKLPPSIGPVRSISGKGMPALISKPFI
ncbi:MAG: hypothetical protein BWZ07_02771 [Alphaproteobacteria bacterium ADurb.BinA280]|nr:MAG: hypothetical protein BWZ07_02771 [Alphaproteobacteria bacterium ADurb.BinA280]